MKSSLGGALLALLSFAVFAAHDVVVKVLGGYYSPFQIVFFHVLFGLPLAVLLMMYNPDAASLRLVHPRWMALRAAAMVVTVSSVFFAFSQLPLAQAYAIIFAAPMLTTVLSIYVLGEQVGKRRWTAIVLGFIGVLIVLRPGVAPLALGHLAAISAALGLSISYVVMRKTCHSEGRIALMLYPMVLNLSVMACILPLIYVPMPLQHLGLVGLISVLNFSAWLILIEAYRRADTVVVAPQQFSQIVWAVIFGKLFFQEVPDLTTWIGAAIIIGSGFYIIIRENAGSGETNLNMLLPETGRRL